MKRAIMIFCVLFISATFAVRAKAQTDLKTLQEIATVCNYYLDGGTYGDSLMFSKAFAPDGQMRFMRNDTLFNISLKDFMARMRNTGEKSNRKKRIDNKQVY